MEAVSPRKAGFGSNVMVMLAKILAAWSLVAGTVIMHAVGLSFLLSTVVRWKFQADKRFWPITWLLIRITSWLIVLHLVQIAIWAYFFWWQNCLPDIETSLYFSGVTYATVGYGDFVLPKEWRLLGPLEGLTGILMCGLSTGVFFAIVSRVYGMAKGPDLMLPR